MIDLEKMNLEDLEKLKLLKEIKELDQPFFKKQFGSIVALIIGVSSVLIGIYTGLFDVKKESLQIEISKFEHRRDSLKNNSDSLIEIIFMDNKKLDSIKAQLKEGSIAYTLLSQTSDSLNKAYKRLHLLADSPIISIIPDLGADKTPGIVLKNVGTSTVFIDQYTVFFDDKCIEVNSVANGEALLRMLGLREYDHFMYFWMTRATKIAIGDRITLIGLNQTNEYISSSDRDKIEAVSKKIAIRILYHGLTKRILTKTFGRTELIDTKCSFSVNKE